MKNHQYPETGFNQTTGSPGDSDFKESLRRRGRYRDDIYEGSDFRDYIDFRDENFRAGRSTLKDYFTPVEQEPHPLPDYSGWQYGERREFEQSDWQNGSHQAAKKDSDVNPMTKMNRSGKTNR